MDDNHGRGPTGDSRDKAMTYKAACPFGHEWHTIGKDVLTTNPHLQGQRKRKPHLQTVLETEHCPICSHRRCTLRAVVNDWYGRKRSSPA